jgi:hypothetical protein
MTPLIDSELLVHIGLHKTASSWLQQRLFSLPDRGFYGPAEAEKWVFCSMKRDTCSPSGSLTLRPRAETWGPL